MSRWVEGPTAAAARLPWSPNRHRLHVCNHSRTLPNDTDVPQVVEGYEVVKAIETCGSRSGETAFDVMVADCGELPAGEGGGGVVNTSPN